MGLISDLVAETNKKCFGSKRMPSAKKFADTDRNQLTKCVIGAVLDSFDELDEPEGKCKVPGCRKKADFELDDLLLCEKCHGGNKCSKVIQPLVNDVLERYDEQFGVNSDESDSEGSDNSEEDEDSFSD